ncbi:uncharacterized protein Z520_11683 [Fonsecaea multimorphosa CBS 102226]|uniref:FAD/NAD(P)-binding domain-containing protein n=1 Tax=Fonsecaea multimorphosa CBS 102226 TaxID=1442371 RepID=A0A0D2JQ80_9EURO|nr:uncharacterized protein Z520_11683 [Fonsecaea multimorphosa CBS 102226]KIX92654.1 hypothetical protein Z520_11683 [Fonsecaea multimorphosa CBS 102226]OAL17878.1 hypothetical protein AYO22_11222 [Fonsecaea multimorphosa]
MSAITNGIHANVISERSIDEPRKIKVIIIGAGVSGILCALELKKRVEDLDLVIYDKNEQLGGTWFENRYPGCACDIPAHCYQLSFESNPAWSQFYATAPEILKYWEKVAAKHDVTKYMKFRSKLVEAQWNDESSKWKVKIQRSGEGESEFTDESDVLISAVGLLNEWRWPQIEGLHDFKGELLHSAAWRPEFDHKDKKVAVIGAGSSGIQIVPSIQPAVKKLDHYVRGKTWIATPMAAKEVEKRTAGTGSNFKFSTEEINAWRADPALYLQYRRTLETELQSGHSITMRGSALQREVKEEFTTLMKSRLALKPDIAQHLLPGFSPLCKRLTPGPGYLEALTQPNVEVIATPIGKVTETGIITEDGELREVDAIVCATGFDTSFRGRSPVIGQNGVVLNEKWADRPDTYLSLSTSQFPNFFMSLGPNSALGAGSLLIILEYFASYIAQCVEKIQRSNIRTIQPSKASVAGFTDFCEQYFQRTVYSEECSSWYKTGGRSGKVTGLWPGSSLHAIRALAAPRWEDFEYTYNDGNSFGWFGNGCSERDVKEMDRAYYLKDIMLEDPLEKTDMSGIVG